MEGEKNGFWRFEGMKMVKNVRLSRAFTDAVAGAITSMAGATRPISAGLDFCLFGMGFSFSFRLGGPDSVCIVFS